MVFMSSLLSLIQSLASSLASNLASLILLRIWTKLPASLPPRQLGLPPLTVVLRSSPVDVAGFTAEGSTFSAGPACVGDPGRMVFAVVLLLLLLLLLLELPDDDVSLGVFPSPEAAVAGPETKDVERKLAACRNNIPPPPPPLPPDCCHPLLLIVHGKQMRPPPLLGSPPRTVVANAGFRFRFSLPEAALLLLLLKPLDHTLR